MIQFRDTTHDDTRRRRLRKAQAVLIDHCPPFIYGDDNSRFYQFSQTIERIRIHMSDCGWGVRLSLR